MKLIHKHNFVSVACMSFTAISLLKLIIEWLLQVEDKNYTMNFLTILFFSFIGTFILSLHSYLRRVPLPLIMIGQYIILILLVLLYTWISSIWIPTAPTAYRDMFFSTAFTYPVCAFIYYINFFSQIQRANQNLKSLRRKENE